MVIAERLRERMKAAKLSQNELARRVGMAQPTIFKLVHGQAYGTTRLHQIAQELGTTPAYLTGETDDPSENAPAPQPPPTVQHVMLPVALPTEAALSRMFRGLLLSLDVPNADELAPELAKLLPTGLQTLRGPLRYDQSVDRDDDCDVPEAQPSGNRARRRA